MEDKDKNKVNERSPFYGKRLVIDNSYEDQENDNYAYWLSLTPEQRILTATDLIRGIYGDVQKRGPGSRIHFDKE